MTAEWTLATAIAAAAPIARARGIEVRAYMVGGAAPTAVRVDLLRGDNVTCCHGTRRARSRAW